MQAKSSYAGVEFEIDDRWRFYVPSLDKFYDSYGLMTNGIDAASKAIVANKREKLSLPVIDKDGNELTLTGIHAGHGHFVVSPKPESSFHSVYAVIPREPWIVAAIEEKRCLEKLAGQIGEVVDKFAIKEGSRYRNFDSSMHASEVARVRKAFDEQTAAAKATNLQAELAKLEPEKKIRL